MTITDYSDALLPEGREVFGVRLLPLCIGHALLLRRVRSPLIGAGEKAGKRESEPGATDGSPSLPLSHSPTLSPAPLPGLGDLLLALEICRLPGVQLPTRARMKWLGIRQLRFTRAQKLRLEGEFLDACLAFRAYWQDAFSRMPGIWQDDKEDVDCGVPGLVGLKLGLMSRFGVSEAETLATPITRAMYDLCAHAAMEGRLKLYTAEEEEMMEAVRARAGEKAGKRESETASGDVLPPAHPPATPAPASLAAVALRAATSRPSQHQGGSRG